MGRDGSCGAVLRVEVAAGGLPPAALSRLARQSWSFNTRMRLTGELEHRDGRFRAIIEGACAIVQPLAARIFCDRRPASSASSRSGRCRAPASGLGAGRVRPRRCAARP